MDPERRRQIEALYQSARGRSPEDRATLLSSISPELRGDVEELLARDPGVSDPATSTTMTMAASVGAGTVLGPYQIEAPLGQGGMGQVFSAIDTRLGRKVAIKLSTEPFSDRFGREAKAISSLNHPHICTLYDVGPNYLVMELVQGETLSQCLAKGPLSAGQILRCGMETADALTAAHSVGIIHRDLKPGNIMLSRNGVKVLDFGLAKFSCVMDGSQREQETLTAKQTIMGTPAYMAPEQALGQAVDARADLFSLGVVMYEMATGRRPFQGDTPMATIDAILHKSPVRPSEFTPSISPGLEQVIEKALKKDREMRYQSASGMLADLKRLLRDTERDSDSGRLTLKTQTTASSGRRRYLLVAMILAVALIGGVWRWSPAASWRRASSPAPLRRLTSDTGLTTESAISPDGKLVAYASDRAGQDNLDIWVQQVDGGSPLRLTSDPANESEPSFSPDGSQIVFRSERDGGGIYTIPALGGESRLIVKGGFNPRFSPDGTRIAYVNGLGGPGGVARGELFVAPLVGGTPRRLVPENIGSAYPVWSPDGKWILYAQGPYRIDDWGIVSSDPDQAASPVLLTLAEFKKAGLADLTPCGWDETNRILFSAKSGDSSHVFELTLSHPGVLSKTWRLSRSPVQLTSGTEQDEKPSLATMAAGGRRLAFTSLVRSENLWSLLLDTDRPGGNGKVERLTEATGAFHVFPAVSADGTKVVYIAHAAYNDAIRLLDLKTGKNTELPAPVSPKFETHIYADGSRVFYGAGGIEVMPTSGGAQERLCGSNGNGWTWDWSLEDKRIMHWKQGRNSVVAGMLNLDTCQDSVFLERPGSELYNFRWSPDRKWLVFQAAKGAHAQVFVAPFTGDQGPDEKAWVPITDGSTWEDKLRWSPNGDWLYSLSDRDGFLCIWAYRLDLGSKKPTGQPVAIFHSHGARLALRNANLTASEMSVARDRIVFNQGEITGNIWLTTLPEN
jgi:serine/threonine protein kinase